MKTKVKCEYCGKLFDKENKEINRCKKQGMGNFCNRSCVGSFRNETMPKEFWKSIPANVNIKKFAGNRKDEYSPFREFLKKSKFSMVRHKNEIDIDLKYLKKLWESQKGICPYTGIKMLLPQSSSKYHKVRSLKKASLDRIDSSKGYLKGNVEFVCLAINLAKCDFEKKDLISFIDEIKPQNTLSITQEQPT